MNVLIATSLVLLLTDIDVTSSRARHSIGRFTKRIINGTNAELYDIPSQVGIFFRGENKWSLLCGGVLIKPDKVLTAAHCMKGEKAINVKVAVGMLNKFGPPTQYEQFIYVKRIKIHDDFDAKANFINDLAILTLANPAILNQNVKVAQLAVNSSNFFNKLCTVSGWGKSNFTENSGKNRLQKTLMTLLSIEECISYWKSYSDQINDRQVVCVLDKQGEPSTLCNGDSGGPLFCGPRLGKLVGVTSFGTKGCPSDSPVVYTDVSQYYRSWIETNS